MAHVKRKYDTTSRQAAAAATRDRICAAAEHLFLRDGYARTSIRTVASTAGVAEATVYVAFANKAALLNAVILRAVRDNSSEPLEVIAAAPPHEIIPRLASSASLLMARAGRLIALGESATFMDAELRAFREQARLRLHTAFRHVADRLDHAGLLRVDAQSAADILYVINSETTYLRMTDDVGLPPDAYARWLADTLTVILLRAESAETQRRSSDRQA
jgi:AcrR family transcriptional regulator